MNKVMLNADAWRNNSLYTYDALNGHVILNAIEAADALGDRQELELIRLSGKEAQIIRDKLSSRGYDVRIQSGVGDMMWSWTLIAKANDDKRLIQLLSRAGED